jgi:hypothetical protein
MNRSMKFGLQLGAGFLALWGVAFGTARMVRAQDESAKPKPSQGRDMFGGINLIKSLKESPGCIGVDAAQTMSGKQVIFAWFENKKAVMAWYGGAAHTQMMKLMPAPTHPPLIHVKNEKMPIMVVAALTPAKSVDPNVRLPVSQISIEMYTTVDGGFAYKGRFAPDSLKVKGMTVDYGSDKTPQKEGN